MAASEEAFTPRNYQVDLMNIALSENTIIYLPTGSGKTFIAIMLLKRMAGDLIRKENRKHSVVLVNTVALGNQHTKYVREHTTFSVGCYTGEMNVDAWNKNKWDVEFSKHHVLVMTCQILCNIVYANIWSLSRINLLIFDECHRGVNDHAMRQLMKDFQHLNQKPRVLGLTATLLNGNCLPSKVSEEIHALEVTYNSKVATVDGLEALIGYSTNPAEKIYTYDVHIPTELERQAIQELESFQKCSTKIKNLEINLKTFSNVDRHLLPLNSKEDLKKLNNLIEDLKFHIKSFGIFGGYKAVLAHAIQVERFKKHCQNLTLYYIYSSIASLFEKLQRMFMKELNKESKMIQKVMRFSSAKIHVLLDILNKFRLESTQQLCGIIFVQRRFTAKILHFILEDLCKYVDGYENVTSNFIVGVSANPLSDTRESLYFNKKNRQIIESFVNKEINILVASDLLEEGVDIPKCTFVCKFDEPLDYRSYVQSKGRARHRSSKYYIMVQKSESSRFLVKYNMFQVVEKTLNKYLVGKNELREKPSAKDVEELYNECEIPPYYVDGPQSAQVNMVTAIPLLCQYCTSLPNDGYTNYSPEWYFDPNIYKTENLFRVVVILPIISSVLDPIMGPKMTSRKSAKRAAALKACEILHKVHELDDNLQPRSRNVITSEALFLFKHYPTVKEPLAGTKKMKRFYKLEPISWVQGQLQPTKEIYLHIINVTPQYSKLEHDINFNTLYDLVSSNLCYGFLTPKRLPKICDFPIYTSSGPLSVKILTNQERLIFNEEEIYRIRRFHHVVFNDVIGVLKPFLVFDNTEEADSIIIVPVNKLEQTINFQVLLENYTVKNKFIKPTSEETLQLHIDNAAYLHKIVTPWYRMDAPAYIVTKVCTDMGPNTPFPNEDYENFREYYRTKYKQSIVNQSQNLLLVKAVSKRMALFKPTSNTAKTKHEKIYEELEEYLLPELVVKQDFPASLWILAGYLPTILSRLAYFLRLQKIWVKIATDCNLEITDIENPKPLLLNEQVLNEIKSTKIDRVKDLTETMISSEIFVQTFLYNKDYVSRVLESEYPWSDLHEPKDIERNLNINALDVEYYEMFLSESVSSDSRELKNFNAGKHLLPAITYSDDYVEEHIHILQLNYGRSPDLRDLYEVFTTVKANDIVNLERLETLGDSFLKFVSSIFIYLKYPAYDEGLATSLKGQLVSNKNLYYLASQKNIGSILKNTEIFPKEEWLPPGFCVPKEIERCVANKKLTINSLYSIDLSKHQQVSGVVDDLLQKLLVEDSSDQGCENSLSNLAHYLKLQNVADKTIADVVEATIGIYFQTCGMMGGVKIIEWFNIIPSSENFLGILKQKPSSPLLKDVSIAEILHFIPQLEEFEQLLGYTFNDKSFLLQALTHASYTSNRITHSYEKLEFLGDAILDFLITCYVFEQSNKLNPGELTDLRSALVNNNTFASFVVKNGFHKFLLIMNSKLQSQIDKFAHFLASKNYEIDNEVLILLQEDDLEIADYIDVPKVLGDIFEALAGGIYLDSGCNLTIVWHIFHKIMWKEIKLFSQNIPKNVLRLLYEKTSAYPQFSKATEVAYGKTMVALKFMSNGRSKVVHGFGSNKTMAKKAAAKIALRSISN